MLVLGSRPAGFQQCPWGCLDDNKQGAAEVRTAPLKNEAMLVVAAGSVM
jgi:hypothetical protein